MTHVINWGTFVTPILGPQKTCSFVDVFWSEATKPLDDWRICLGMLQKTVGPEDAWMDTFKKQNQTNDFDSEWSLFAYCFLFLSR